MKYRERKEERLNYEQEMRQIGAGNTHYMEPDLKSTRSSKPNYSRQTNLRPQLNMDPGVMSMASHSSSSSSSDGEDEIIVVRRGKKNQAYVGSPVETRRRRSTRSKQYKAERKRSSSKERSRSRERPDVVQMTPTIPQSPLRELDVRGLHQPGSRQGLVVAGGGEFMMPPSNDVSIVRAKHKLRR